MKTTTQTTIEEHFKRSFLRKMLLGLKLGGIMDTSETSLLSIQERKRIIRLAADVAVAYAAGAGSLWSHSLISTLSKKQQNSSLVKKILGKDYKKFMNSRRRNVWPNKSQRALRRARSISCSTRVPSRILASRSSRSLARIIVKKRTQVLKRLVPGGQRLRGTFLLDEAMDYVAFLRAQVHLLGRLANYCNFKEEDQEGLFSCKKL